MSVPGIFIRHALTSVEEGAYQTFGDMVFYPNGGVRLGGTWFAYRTSIHRYRFGANLIAMRGQADLNTIEVETPAQGRLRFLYRPLFRKWYQLVEVHDPWLQLHQQRYGNEVAIGLYYVRGGLRSFLIGTLNLAVCCLLGALFVLGVNLLAWLF